MIVNKNGNTSLTILAKLLHVFLIVFITASLLSSLIIMAMLISPDSFPAADKKQFEWISNLIALIFVLINITFFAIAIIFLSWLYVIYKQLSAQESLKISPGWAIAWFLIPVANMVMPYYVLRGVSRKNNIRQNYVVELWWVLWFLTFIIPSFLMILSFINSKTIYYPVLAVASIGLLFAAQGPFLIKILRDCTKQVILMKSDDLS